MFDREVYLVADRSVGPIGDVPNRPISDVGVLQEIELWKLFKAQSRVDMSFAAIELTQTREGSAHAPRTPADAMCSEKSVAFEDSPTTKDGGMGMMADPLVQSRSDGSVFQHRCKIEDEPGHMMRSARAATRGENRREKASVLCWALRHAVLFEQFLPSHVVEWRLCLPRDHRMEAFHWRWKWGPCPACSGMSSIRGRVGHGGTAGRVLIVQSPSRSLKVPK
ncbi:hypothetical protein VDGL01_07969 [Verticillium dahliae]